MRFRHLLIHVILAAVAVAGTSGCGQKGPLVPPKTALAQVSATTQAIIPAPLLPVPPIQPGSRRSNSTG